MTKPRSMMPREHGAYAELLFPLLTGLALGRPGVAAFGFAMAAVLFFLLHEPVAVVVGARGAYAQEKWAPRARQRVAWLAVGGALFGGIAVYSSTRDARLASLVPVACGLALAPFVLRRSVKTLPAEIVVVATLSSLLLPVAIAGSASWWVAWFACSVWFVSFSLGTFAVHAVKAITKPLPGDAWKPAASIVLGLLTIGGAIALAFARTVAPALAFAFLPTALVTVAAVILRVHTRHLKRVGWTMAAAQIVTATLLLAV